MDLSSLTEHFAIPGILAFSHHNGLLRADITSPSCSATLYLQGAHLTHWQPAGHQPVLFTSSHTELAPGKPIRGGVPILFPWFATDTQNRASGQPGPSHGFARIQPWQLAFAAIAGEDLHLTFTLAPTDLSRSLGYDHFRAAFQLILGRTLTLRLTVANDDSSPLTFEEGLHTYFAVDDIHQVSVTGLEPTPCIDKTDNMQLRPAAGRPLTFAASTDSVYLDTSATCTLTDPAAHRRITIEKTGSNTTVVWNPWIELAHRLPDFGDNEWPHMLCVETVNAFHNSITLAPGETHTLAATISVISD